MAGEQGDIMIRNAFVIWLICVVTAAGQIAVSSGGRSLIVSGRGRQAVSLPSTVAAPRQPADLPEPPAPRIRDTQASAPVEVRPKTAKPTFREVRYLISEPWCGLCPAAKRRFLAAGNPASRIISMAEARRRFGVSHNPPYEFTIRQRVSSPAAVRTASYRSQWPPVWSVNGERNPSRGYLLSHLRNNPNHRGKHWQDWDLESWTKEQLAALHDDDHTGNVAR